MKNILYQVFFIVMLSGCNLSLTGMDQVIEEKIKKLKRAERVEIIEHILLCWSEFEINQKFDKQRKELRLISDQKDQ